MPVLSLSVVSRNKGNSGTHVAHRDPWVRISNSLRARPATWSANSTVCDLVKGLSLVMAGMEKGFQKGRRVRLWIKPCLFPKESSTRLSSLPGSSAWYGSALGHTLSPERPTLVPTTCLPRVNQRRPPCSWRTQERRMGWDSGPAVTQQPRAFQDPALRALIEIQEAVLLPWLKCSSAGLLFHL